MRLPPKGAIMPAKTETTEYRERRHCRRCDWPDQYVNPLHRCWPCKRWLCEDCMSRHQCKESLDGV